MKVMKALRPLSGSYGHVHPNEQFTVSDDIAEELEMRGLAVRFYDPVKWIPIKPLTYEAPELPLSYETKMSVPVVPPIKVSTHVRTRKRK
jgi:hypothetical protein